LVKRAERAGGGDRREIRADEFIFMRGDRFDYWTGVVSGQARMGIMSAAARRPASPA